MSVEYRPVSEIRFQMIDKRLEKYGIKVEHRRPVTALTGPFGTLFATPEGSSTHFQRALGVDTQAVMDAIQMEYGIEVIDENDYRFWGFSSAEEMEEALRSTGPTRNRVLVEGPLITDAEFTASWLGAAASADAALDAYLQANPRSRESLFCDELPIGISFAASAMEFVGRWLEGHGIFEIHLGELGNGEMFSIMLAAGFFARTGDRYQMTIPRDVNILGIRNGLIQLADTRDDAENLHPEKLMLSMTKSEAETWKMRLLDLDSRQRLADRDALLESCT